MLIAVARRALYDDWEPEEPRRAGLAAARPSAVRLRAAGARPGPRLGRRQRGAAPAGRALHLQGHRAACGAQARPRARDPQRGRLARGQQQRRDARDRGGDLQAQVGAGRQTHRPRERRVVLPARLRAARAIRTTPTRGSTRPSSATSWRSSRSARPGSRARRRRCASAPTRSAAGSPQTTPGDGGWGDATLGEALFGLGRFEEAAEHLARVPGGAGGTAVATGDDRDAARRARASAPLRLAAALRPRSRRWSATGRGPSCAPPPARSAWRSPAAASAPRCFTSEPSPGWRSAGCCAGSRCSRASPAARSSAPTTTSSSAGCWSRRPTPRSRTPTTSPSCASSPRSSSTAVRGDLRGRLFANVADNWKMLWSRYSRTDRAAELFERMFFAGIPKDGSRGDRGVADDRPLRAPARARGRVLAAVRELAPRGEGADPGPQRDHPEHRATTGSSRPRGWASRRPGRATRWTRAGGCGASTTATCRRRQSPPALGKAVGASACVPALFPPVTMAGLYEGIDVELVDGGVHDNQGIASLLDQDCTVVLVSDASGQMRDAEHPKRDLLGVASRSNSVLMARVRSAQITELASLRRSERAPRADDRPPEEGLAGAAARLDRLPGALPARGRRARPRCRRRAAVPDRPRGPARARGAANGSGRVLRRRGVRADGCRLRDDPGSSSARRWATPRRPTRSSRRGVVAVRGDAGEARPTGRRERAGHGAAPGRARFFRGLVAWRLRRAQQPRGSLGRLLDRTGIAAVPRLAARGAEVVVVSPLRKIVSAPIALVGGLATKLSLIGTRSGRPPHE